MKTYAGFITKLEPHQIFVFGSNSQGKHGKGAALWARENAGAIYGQSKGLQGRSYAIVTKHLFMYHQPSIPEKDIIDQIGGLYDFANQYPEFDLFNTQEFLVAYSGVGTNLNGYTPKQMAAMFSDNSILPIPDNIVFELEFSKLLNV